MTSGSNEEDDTVWVLRQESIRRAFDTLLSTKIHPFFPGYLLIRRDAVRNQISEEIVCRWEDMGSYLRVPDGTKDLPFVRPFTEGTNPHGVWLNSNLAGSWAPSSVREGKPPRELLSPGKTRGAWNLLSNHASLAREHLLFGQAIDGLAVAAFLYRDFGFFSGQLGEPPDISVVFNVFARDFEFVTRNGGAHRDLTELFRLDSQQDYEMAFETFEPTRRDLSQ